MNKPRHSITAVDAKLRIADCGACGSGVPVRFKAHKARWVCRASDGRRSPAAKRRNQLKFRFAITDADYAALLEAQGGACAICQRPCATGRNLAVDHDHETDRIRGLLCNKCNRAIGLMADRPELLLRAANYLTN